MIKYCLKNSTYWVFNILSRIRTNFYSETFVAIGYFIKNAAYFRHSTATVFKKDRFALHEKLGKQYLHGDEEILYVEFGVRWGYILKCWASYNGNKNSLFWGFDTFTGIPEDWGSVKAGSFSMEGEVPKLDDERVQFHIGLVQDTLPQLLTNFDRSRKLILHFDFDLYNATLFAMLAFQPFLKKGDILIFDEFFSISKNHHEYRAFSDFLSLYKYEYKPLFKIREGQYAIELI